MPLTWGARDALTSAARQLSEFVFVDLATGMSAFPVLNYDMHRKPCREGELNIPPCSQAGYRN